MGIFLFAFLPLLSNSNPQIKSYAYGVTSSGYATCPTSGTCSSVTVMMYVQTGTVLVIAGSAYTGSVSSSGIADTLSNSFVAVKTDTDAATQTYLWLSNVTTGGADSITVSWSGVTYAGVAGIDANNVNQSASSYTTCSAGGSGNGFCASPIALKGVSFSYLQSNQGSYCTLPSMGANFTILFNGLVSNNCFNGGFTQSK